MNIPVGTVPGRRRSGSETRARRRAVGVRLTLAERAELDRLAAGVGMSAADWLRRAGLGRRLPTGRGGTSPGDAAILRQLAGALGRIGNNLNQIARATNVDLLAGRAPSPDVAALLGIGDALDRIGLDVRRALGVEGVGDPLP